MDSPWGWTRWTLVLAATIGLAVGGADAAPAKAQAKAAATVVAGQQPKIQVDKPVHDFGKVWNDQTVEHEFEVKNVGRAPLNIKRVRTTCGCMPVKTKPQTLEPGASTKIKVRLNAKNLRGKIKKTVYVESNDPKKLRCPMSFVGEVLRPITMVPAMARFSRVDRKHPSTLELTLANNLDEPMALSNPQSTLPNVAAKITEIEKGKKFKVTLTAKPPYVRGLLSGQLTLETGLKKRPAHRIHFFGQLPSPIEIQPTRIIDLGVLDNTKEYKKTVRIISTDDTQFDITEVSTTNWRFTPVVRQVAEKQEYQIEITARPPYAWEANRAYIKFKTTGTGAPNLMVTIHGRLPRPVAIAPSSLLFRNLTQEKGGQASVTLKVEDASAMKITSVKSTLECVEAKVEPVEEGKAFKLTATAKPPLKPGRLQGEIVLETTHPKVKTLAVPIQSFPIRAPLPAVSVIPDPRLVVPRTGATTKPVSSRFIVRANRDEKVRVTKVEVSNKVITTSIEPHKGAEDKMVFIRITMPGDAKLNPKGETVTIYTDNPKLPKITRLIAQAGTPGAVSGRSPSGPRSPGPGSRRPISERPMP